MKMGLLDFIDNIKSYENEIIDHLKHGRMALRDVPEFLVSEKVALESIVYNSDNFELIPSYKKNNVISLAACQIKSSLLSVIPSECSLWVNSVLNEPILKFLLNDLKTREICIFFVSIDYNNISYVPNNLLAEYEFLVECCQANPRILSKINDDLIDFALCNVAISAKGFSLDCLPEKWRTADNCSNAFNANYKEIIHFPKENITYDYVLRAVELCEPCEVLNILKLVSVEDWDDELLIKATTKNENIIDFIPKDRITSKLLFNVAPYITRCETLFCVPDSLFSKNLINHLVGQNPLLLGAVPVELRDRQLCFNAVAKNGMALNYIPRNVQTDEIYQTAVSNDGMALRFVPAPYRDASIPEIAVAQNGEAIQYIPEYYMTELLARKAVMQNAGAIYFVPKRFISYELYNLALESIPEVLSLIPPDSRTIEQCILAIKKDVKMLDYVPVQIRELDRFQNTARDLGLL